MGGAGGIGASRCSETRSTTGWTMATRGNVYVRARLHVTALRQATGEQKLEVAVGDGAVSEFGQLLCAAEVRDLHRELGNWLDAIEQERAGRTGAADEDECPVCSPRADA